jgi:hypothetical protein
LIATSRARPLVGALALALFLAALVACNGGGGATPTPGPGATATAGPTEEPTLPAQTPSPAATASPSPQPEPTPSLEPSFEGGSGPQTATGAQGALLVQVRYGRHADFDRAVFQFEEGRPGYRIAYAQPPILGEFSGLPIEIAGEAFLRVNFAAAAHDEDGLPTYLGPRELKPGLPALLEAVETGDFENSLTWVLGLSGAGGFRVFALDEPFRVVVDVGHPE